MGQNFSGVLYAGAERFLDVYQFTNFYNISTAQPGIARGVVVGDDARPFSHLNGIGNIGMAGTVGLSGGWRPALCRYYLDRLVIGFASGRATDNAEYTSPV